MHGRIPITGLLPVALLCVALTGCSGDEAPSESPQPESESHSAPETLEEVQAQVNAEYDEVTVNLNEADPRYGAELTFVSLYISNDDPELPFEVFATVQERIENLPEEYPPARLHTVEIASGAEAPASVSSSVDLGTDSWRTLLSHATEGPCNSYTLQSGNFSETDENGFHWTFPTVTLSIGCDSAAADTPSLVHELPELMEQAAPALDLVSLVELSVTLKDERTTITHASGGGRGITDERLDALEQVAEIVDEADHEEVRIDNTPRGIAVSATIPEDDVWIGEQIVEVLRPLDLTHSPVLLSSTDQPTESILYCTARSGCQ